MSFSSIAIRVSYYYIIYMIFRFLEILAEIEISDEIF
jgi:hypothetical protein